MYNFKEIYNFLESMDISEMINDEKELSKKLIKNFEDMAVIDQKKIDLLNVYGKKILKETAIELDTYLK